MTVPPWPEAGETSAFGEVCIGRQTRNLGCGWMMTLYSRSRWRGVIGGCVRAAILTLGSFAGIAGAQVHPPEVRLVYPIGGSAGLTTRVTIAGVSFRNARQIIFDQPGIAARIVAPDFSKLPPVTIDNDNATYLVADFTVDRTAPHDLYSFRVISDYGVSSAGKWMVGRELPQIEEKEPNNGRAQSQAVTLPVAINGHIGDASDMDTYAVELEAGKTFVAEVVAAQAGSPLDSMVTLETSEGSQIASNDDFGGPDSVLVYTPKTSGRYFLTISSSVGSGSPVHAYRLSLGVLPLLTGTLPGTLPRGKTTTVTAMGVNLPSQFPVSIPAGWPYGLAHVNTSEGVSSNGIIVGVSDLSLVLSGESNTDAAHAQQIAAPAVVNGRFYSAASHAPSPYFYRFHAEAGRRYLIDVRCQDRSGARCDPLLTLYDTSGAMVEESDDSQGRDCHLDRTFDKSADYVLRVKNLDAVNSPDMVYQLMIQGPPPPDFSITTETRARAIGQGGSAAFEVQVIRDRWNGPVTLTATDLPSGVTASSVTVPDGVARGLVVLTAAADAPITGFPLHITGTGDVGGKKVTHVLTRATDRIWNGGAMTLQPAPVDTLFYAVSPPNEVAVRTDAKSVDLVPGKSVKIRAKFERRPGFDKPFTLNALGLPDGVTAAPVPVPAGTMEVDLELKAMPNVRPGSYAIVLDAVTANNPQVMLDRVSLPISLNVAAVKPPAKSASLIRFRTSRTE